MTQQRRQRTAAAATRETAAGSAAAAMAGVGSEPFTRQLDRETSALQRAAQLPLRALSNEEQAHQRTQEAEAETAALRRAFEAVKARAEVEVLAHQRTQALLAQTEAACRRLGVLQRVQEERTALGSSAAQAASSNQSDANQPATSHLLSQKPRDIRVHGGSGSLNRLAFGSEHLQDLIDQHGHVARATGGSHGRRASLSHEMRVQQAEAQASETARRQEHIRAMNERRQQERSDTNQYDIFGNVVRERAAAAGAPAPEENTRDLFSGMGTYHRQERVESEPRGDHFAHAKAPAPTGQRFNNPVGQGY